jgi:hypothetical protein
MFRLSDDTHTPSTHHRYTPRPYAALMRPYKALLRYDSAAQRLLPPLPVEASPNSPGGTAGPLSINQCLHVACGAGHVSVVAALLDESNANPMHRGPSGTTPFVEAARHGKAAVVDVLIRAALSTDRRHRRRQATKGSSSSPLSEEFLANDARKEIGALLSGAAERGDSKALRIALRAAARLVALALAIGDTAFVEHMLDVGMEVDLAAAAALARSHQQHGMARWLDGLRGTQKSLPLAERLSQGQIIRLRRAANDETDVQVIDRMLAGCRDDCMAAGGTRSDELYEAWCRLRARRRDLQATRDRESCIGRTFDVDMAVGTVADLDLSKTMRRQLEWLAIDELVDPSDQQEGQFDAAEEPLMLVAEHLSIGAGRTGSGGRDRDIDDPPRRSAALAGKEARFHAAVDPLSSPQAVAAAASKTKRRWRHADTQIRRYYADYNSLLASSTPAELPPGAWRLQSKLHSKERKYEERITLARAQSDQTGGSATASRRISGGHARRRQPQQLKRGYTNIGRRTRQMRAQMRARRA